MTAVKDWLGASGVETGPLLRGTRNGKAEGKHLGSRIVGRIAKKAAAALGYDPELYSAHSLRAGHVTTASFNGASDHVIADQTRHQDLKMLRTYRRPRSVFRDNSAGYLGL